MVRGLVALVVALVACVAILVSCCDSSPRSGQVQDEAKRAGRDAASFPAATEDYFHDMDNGVALTPSEVAGRNMWIVWTGGDDRFWDAMTISTFGAFDLLKLVTSYPTQKIRRDTRWQIVGLLNDPCYEKASQPDPDRFFLYLDMRKKGCAPDPFEIESKYPGVAIGARGKTFADGKKLPVGSFYGYGTGIVGLRLFPNPDFDEAAEKRWDAEKFYNDPAYFNDAKLVRPYRVGMSCGFCHVGPSPSHPPADPANPQWSELSSSVGAQYLWVDQIFADNSGLGAQPDSQRKNFIYQLVHTYRPGTMDTSLVSTDNINNPRTMNAIYNVSARLLPLAIQHGKETLGKGNLLNKQFNQYPDFAGSPLDTLFKAPDIVWTPRVLKDGSDSVGVLGALNRVYINIGLFSEEWLLHFNAIVGGKPITPIEIAVAERNSTYWQVTEAGTPNMARFFLKAAQPDKLAAAPGGAKYLTADAQTLARGRTVFAETCARCHSSKAPPPAAEADAGACAGAGYLDCWNRYWAWTKTDDFKAKMRQIVDQPDFLDGNFLSSELRVPVTLLRTNACSPLATNALAGNIWDNFSSQSYKDLPSVGAVKYHDPITGEEKTYMMPAGGRGYTRPPSLIAVWSTAPFLLNNTVGMNAFEQDPSVDARMRVFNASINELLWPEKRPHDTVLGDKVAWIDRTTERSEIFIPAGYAPAWLRPPHTMLENWLPWLLTPSGDVTIGPIPKGIPINLLANFQPLYEPQDMSAPDLAARAKHWEELLKLLKSVPGDLAAAAKDQTDDQLKKTFANLAEPLLALSKCPDFEVNRGHYFGTSLAEGEPGLSDDDKHALIEFIKTF
jgi:hypothetical protein